MTERQEAVERLPGSSSEAAGPESAGRETVPENKPETAAAEQEPAVSKDRGDMRQRILSGPILPTVIRLAAPIIGANLLETVYEWTDTFWLGRVGPEAVGAVALSFPAFILVVSFALGFTIAGTALVAQRTGAGDKEGVNQVAGQTILLVGGLSVVLAIVGVRTVPLVLRLMQTPAEVWDGAHAYLRIFYFGLPSMFFFFLFEALLRGWGDTVTPMKIMAVSVGLNVILDPALIFGWGPFPTLGVAGAAYATVISRSTAAAIALVLMIRGNYGIKVKLPNLKPDLKVLRQIVTLGLPSSVEMSIRGFDMSLMTGLVAAFGSTALAAYGITGRLFSLVILMAMAVSIASTTMVGQNVGANQYRRALASGWTAAGLTFVATSAFAVLCLIIPEQLVGMFNRDPGVLEVGSHFLRTVSPLFGFVGVAVVLAGGLRGAGRTFAPLVFAILTGFVLRFPVAWLLSTRLGWGLTGVWWGLNVSYLFGSLMIAWWFQRVGRADSSPAGAADAGTG